MNFIEFIKTKLFLRHFILSVVLSAAIITIILTMLKGYTHHGESYVVPSLVGLLPEQIEQLETINNFEVLIIDSVFDSRQPKGTVLIQEPVAGAHVKKSRKIYLTTVAVLPEQIKMPNLVDLTLRQAKATIETYGLRLGEINYVPDIATNAVLAQSYKGRAIEPGDELLKGSVIDLKVGEETGKLPEMLDKIADTYDEEVDNAVGALTSMIEPLMIVFLAVVVGGIVIALFAPMIKMIDKLGG